MFDVAVGRVTRANDDPMVLSAGRRMRQGSALSNGEGRKDLLTLISSCSKAQASSGSALRALSLSFSPSLARSFLLRLAIILEQAKAELSCTKFCSANAGDDDDELIGRQVKLVELSSLGLQSPSEMRRPERAVAMRALDLTAAASAGDQCSRRKQGQ